MCNIIGIDVGGQRMKLYYNNTFKQIVSSENLDKKRLFNILKEFCTNIDVAIDVIAVAHPGIVNSCRVLDGCWHKYEDGLSIEDFKNNGYKDSIFINDSESCAFYASKKYNSSNILSITLGTGFGCSTYNGNNFVQRDIYTKKIDTPEGLMPISKLCSAKRIMERINLPLDSILENSTYVNTFMQQSGILLGKAILLSIQEYNPEVVFVSGGAHNFVGYFESANIYIKDHIHNKNISVYFCNNDFSGCIGAIKYYESQKS